MDWNGSFICLPSGQGGASRNGEGQESLTGEGSFRRLLLPRLLLTYLSPTVFSGKTCCVVVEASSKYGCAGGTSEEEVD